MILLGFFSNFLFINLIQIGPVVLENKIFKGYQCIFAISVLSLLGVVFPLNKPEFSAPTDVLCQSSLVEIGSEVFELSVVIVFSPFCYYLRLKGLNKLEFPSPKDDLCQVWLKLVYLFWKKKMKMWKVNRRTEGRTRDKRRSKSSLEISAQVS